ncbi:MAG: ATP-dependent DNA helicase [Gammaproteobacteria bacterium]|nr:ATP-dependent DNA helicase [Gammaproteobacteria bacterium]MCW8987822.1 ATP-dependent DNA helicase [Gammaproteobacteria bacterium]MCW9030506.1 ATP-dependent DNA helicase [Gammaproteobacteria bacterium]
MQDSDVSYLLSEKGPIAKLVPGFAARQQQQEMAERVAAALEDGNHLIAEAGTGTGKTFAYLVPALMSQSKVLISTGTKNLQDQLFHKDLPIVSKALAVPATVAILKGRANYLCLHRLDLAEQEGQFRTPEIAHSIIDIRAWATQTRSGDIAEMSSISEEDLIWASVTSTSDNCLGSDCSYFDSCHLVEARRQAQAADIVVINHHLLFADMMLREDGFADLLPQADAIIVDEAHQLPEVASSFFGESISGNQLLELARDCESEYLAEVNEDPNFVRIASVLQKLTKDLRLSFGTEQRREAWQSIAHDKEFKKAILAVAEQLEKLQRQLTPLAERSKGLESCYERCVELSSRFTRLTTDVPEDHIHWFETHRRSFTLHITPFDISEIFHSQMQTMDVAWIFTSATLTVADSFEHYKKRLGIETDNTAIWDSPFDYGKQAVMYVPESLPDPTDPDYTEAVVAKALPIIEACQGGVFFLFTSHKALQQAADLLDSELSVPLMVQGDKPRDVLLSEFRHYGNAVLLGTSSFWEGVDVRGEALTCVIIDKLPFASPGDPVLKARIDTMRKQGGNPFIDFQLPTAVITLKQGAGRLIRDVNDRGVLMLCDPRLITKSYGKIFIDSLPAMMKTRNQEKVEGFLRIKSA